MALIDNVKDVLRESGNQSNTEIQDLIDAANFDLKMAGVKNEKIETPDKLIIRAINLYCKAHYSYEDPKTAERFSEEYEKLKKDLMLSFDYREVVQ
jgi:hypothetical protein